MQPFHEANVGDEGVIAVLHGDRSPGVRFDRNVQGHDLEGACPTGHGFWLPEEWLMPIEAPATIPTEAAQ